MKKRKKLLIIICTFAFMFLTLSPLKAGAVSLVQPTDVPKNMVPIYRMFNPANAEHFYTDSWKETSVLCTQYGFEYEGVGWYAPKYEKDFGDVIYRFFSPKLRVHRYTTDKEEARAMRLYGWEAEGTICYSAKETKVPVYRLLDFATQLQNFTKNPVESAHNMATGWKYEGIGWYSMQ